MPRLLLKFDAAVVKEIAVDKPALSVGRKADNDVVIDNPAISGHHCRILWDAGVCSVEDLDSTNGTFVNQKRVMKAVLRHNDVVSLAKHSLVFLEEAEETLPPPLEAPAEPSAPKDGKTGALRVLKGMADSASEYELKGLSTYIGKSDRAQVRIKGGGLFGGAPEVAASIHWRPEGYMLAAVEAGYPKVNGESVSGQVQLKDGDIIECGATTLQFFLKNPPKT